MQAAASALEVVERGEDLCVPRGDGRYEGDCQLHVPRGNGMGDAREIVQGGSERDWENLGKGEERWERMREGVSKAGCVKRRMGAKEGGSKGGWVQSKVGMGAHLIMAFC